MAHKSVISVASNFHPRVKIDPQCGAVYIRFNKGKIVKTVNVDSNECIVNADLNEQGNVVGIELFGITHFQIESLLKTLPYDAPDLDVSKMRFEFGHETDTTNRATFSDLVEA